MIGRRMLRAGPWCGVAACGVAAWGVACATVTQEEPPSRQTGAAGDRRDSTAPTATGAGGAASDPTPSAGGSGGAAGAGATGGEATGGSAGAAGVAAGGADSVPASGGTAGDATEPPGGAVVDAAPQFPSGTLLFSDDFEDFSAADWVTTGESIWAIATDPEVMGSVYGQSETGSSGRHLAAAGDATWTNVVMSADFKILEFNGSSSTYMAGLCVRVRDEDNFYFVGIRSNDGEVGLRRFGDSNNNLVQSDFDQGTTGVWYHMRVEAIGSTITAYLDDELMFTQQDTSHAAGGVGLCTVRASAVFDNVVVTAP